MQAIGLPKPTPMLASTGLRFLLVGCVSFGVNQAALFLFYEGPLARAPRLRLDGLGAIDLGLLVASLVAVELSILVRFLLNDRWTFRGRSEKRFIRRLYESNLSSLASPVLSLAAVNLLTPVLGVPYLIANALGVLLGLAWNWLWSTRVVWREPAAEEA